MEKDLEMIGTCDVCSLVDSVETAKPVRFCETCNSWICDVCRPKKLKRAKAMLLKIYLKQTK